MQKFYFKSNDGEEYGPISASDVREWQNQGRMNNESLARYSNSRDWKHLSDFSELNTPTPTQRRPRLSTSSRLYDPNIWNYRCRMLFSFWYCRMGNGS